MKAGMRIGTIIAYLIKILVFPLLIGMGIITILIRLDNPELTETQLFLEYWRTWLIMLFVAVGIRFSYIQAEIFLINNKKMYKK